MKSKRIEIISNPFLPIWAKERTAKTLGTEFAKTKYVEFFTYCLILEEISRVMLREVRNR